MKYAAIDILSGRRELYAPKGAELTIHRYSGHVAFCSWNGGEQFPCHVDKLSDIKPASEPVRKALSAKDAELIEKYKQSLL